MPAITITDLTNAKLDVDHIATIANSTELTVTDRLGHTKPTMAGMVANLNVPTAITETGVNRSLAVSAKIDAEAARDSVNTTGKVFTAAEGTAAGLAATTNGQQFAILSSDSQSWSIYRNNSGAALAVGPGNYTKSVIDSLKESLSVPVIQTIGRPLAPIDGTGASADAVLMGNPITTSGSLQSFQFYAKTIGTLTLGRYVKSGSNVTRVSSVPITISAVGLKTLTATDFGIFPVTAGEYLSVQGNLVFTYSSTTTADGVGWWNLTGSTPATGTVGALVTTTRIEAAWAVTSNSQTVTSAAFSTIQNGFANKVDLSTLSATVAQVIGRPIAPIDGTGVSPGNYVMASPVSAAITAFTLKFFAKVTGSVQLSKYTREGNVLTRTGVAAYTVTSLGLNTLTEANFGNMTFAVGDLVGLEGSGIYTYTAGAAVDSTGWWQIASGSASATIGTANTTGRLEFSLSGSRLMQTVTATSFQSVQTAANNAVTNAARVASNVSAVLLPLIIVADGNSLTAGFSSSPTYRPSDRVVSSMSITGYNFGVSGQTTQQMTLDAATQIDPYAATAGVIPILIAQEIFNDIRVNGITVAAAVTNMQNYCQGRRAAGFFVGVCNLADMEPIGGFTAGMVAAVNAELAARWWTFADFLVDIYAANEMRDRTNTTYFNADKTHNTNLGYAVMGRQQTLAIRQWLMSR